MISMLWYQHNFQILMLVTWCRFISPSHPFSSHAFHKLKYDITDKISDLLHLWTQISEGGVIGKQSCACILDLPATGVRVFLSALLKSAFFQLLNALPPRTPAAPRAKFFFPRFSQPPTPHSPSLTSSFLICSRLIWGLISFSWNHVFLFISYRWERPNYLYPKICNKIWVLGKFISFLKGPFMGCGWRGVEKW